MKNNHSSMISILLILMMASMLACGALPLLKGTVEEPVAEEPSEAEEAASEEEPVERVLLDPCSLLTNQEVSDVLGGPVEMLPAQGTGGCIYVLQSDDPTSVTQLITSAAQGNEAKVFTVLSVVFLAGFSGDPDIEAEFEELNDQLAEMRLVEVVNRMAEMFEGTGVNVTQVDGLGESALWMLYEDDFYSQGTLLVVRGEEYASLTLIGGDVATAPERLASLAEKILDRLPPAFYLLDEDGDGDFSFEYSSEDAQVESEEPMESDQTLEVVSGLVWVTAPNAGQVFAIDPMTHQIAATIDIGRFPADIAVAEGNVWVVSETEGALWRIDPVTFEVTETITYGGSLSHVAAGQGFVWVTGEVGIRTIDVATGTRYDVVYNRCYDVAIGENAIWVSQSQDQQLLKIDPETREVVATVKLEGQPTEIAYGLGAVWTILSDKNEVVGIDPNTDQVVTTVSGEGFIHALTIGPNRVWYTSPASINYIDPTMFSFGSFSVTHPAFRIVYYAGSLWATNSGEGLITRIHPENYRTIAEIVVDADPFAIAAGE